MSEFINEILGKKVCILSYYYIPKLWIVMEVASRVSKRRKVCIQGLDRVKWELYPYSTDFNLSCDQGSYLIQFEAEEFNEKADLITSTKRARDNRVNYRVDKAFNNVYKAVNDEGRLHIFKLREGHVEDVSLGKEETYLISVLSELGGEAELRDLVNICSRKMQTDRDHVRRLVYYLRDVGYLDLTKGRVSLKAERNIEGSRRLQGE